MNKKRIWITIGVVIAMGLTFLFYQLLKPAETYIPTNDEIAIHIQLKIKEDIGLIVFDYQADDSKQSGGISNANKSLIKHDSDNIQVWDRQSLHSTSDSVALWIQFRFITEYVDPNFENIYPQDLTVYLPPISFEAQFG
jgi:hypothetical protein